MNHFLEIKTKNQDPKFYMIDNELMTCTLTYFISDIVLEKKL